MVQPSMEGLRSTGIFPAVWWIDSLVCRSWPFSTTGDRRSDVKWTPCKRGVGYGSRSSLEDTQEDDCRDTSVSCRSRTGVGESTVVSGRLPRSV